MKKSEFNLTGGLSRRSILVPSGVSRRSTLVPSCKVLGRDGHILREIIELGGT